MRLPICFVRSFAALFGLTAIVWGTVSFSGFWRQQAIEHTADAIIDRDSFRPGAFETLLPTIEQDEERPWCWPEASHDGSVVHLRRAEDAMAAGERSAIDDRLSALAKSVRQSLACAPSDPFLWVVLAWADDARNGFQQRQLTYLGLSYETGASEGWIAARRNRLAVSMFSRLSPELSASAVHEFAHMVDSWIDPDAIGILTGPGWPERGLLLASLNNVGLRQREAFAKALYAEGYDVAVPGILPPAPRLWH